MLLVVLAVRKVSGPPEPILVPEVAVAPVVVQVTLEVLAAMVGLTFIIDNMTPSHNIQYTSSITVGALAVTWIDTLDVWLRIGASAVAIVSGIIVAVIAIKNYLKGK
jgi:hypothetical protein